jgi:aminoglycoside phosphotransferase (APT) family kinase protein
MTFSGNLPSEDEIVSLCQSMPQEKLNESIRYGEDIWIKFGREISDLTAEVQAQMYAFQHADRSSVSVPEVFHWFQRDDRMYIVMEYIEGKNLQQYLRDDPPQAERWDDAVSEAIRSLWEFPVPSDARPGPLGGGWPRGPMWGEDFSTDHKFQSKEDLESWINGMLEENKRPETMRVNFSSERLAFSHGDLSPRHFIVQGSKLFLVDFGASGFYPVCFDEAGLCRLGNWSRRIRQKLFPSRSANLRSLRHLRYLNLVGFTGIKPL